MFQGLVGKGRRGKIPKSCDGGGGEGEWGGDCQDMASLDEHAQVSAKPNKTSPTLHLVVVISKCEQTSYSTQWRNEREPVFSTGERTICCFSFILISRTLLQQQQAGTSGYCMYRG